MKAARAGKSGEAEKPAKAKATKAKAEKSTKAEKGEKAEKPAKAKKADGAKKPAKKAAGKKKAAAKSSSSDLDDDDGFDDGGDYDMISTDDGDDADLDGDDDAVESDVPAAPAKGRKRDKRSKEKALIKEAVASVKQGMTEEEIEARRSHLRQLAASNGIPAKRVDEVLDITGLTSVAKKRVKGIKCICKSSLFFLWL